MEMKSILSIVIPVFNGVSTISRLLDSIFSQCGDEIEVIVIDDGSSDNLESYLNQKYENISNLIFIKKNNSGVSETRNLGIKKANSKFITFADCDDFYEDNTLNSLVEFLKDNEISLLCFNYYNTYEDGKKVKMLNMVDNELFISANGGLINYLNGTYFKLFNSAVWNKVFRRDILLDHKIVFDSNKRIGEDLLFNMEYFLNVRKICLFDKSIYNYYQQENSVMRRYNDYFLIDLMAYLSSFYNIIKKYELNIPEKEISVFFISRFFGLLNNESNGKEFNKGLSNLHEFVSFCSNHGFFKKIEFMKLSFKYKLFYSIMKSRLYYVIYFILYFKNKIN